MAKEIWRGKVFEVRPHAEFVRDGGPAALPSNNYNFTVTADGSDEAKRLARAWLTDRKKKIRSMAIDAKTPRQLIIYIEPGQVP